MPQKINGEVFFNKLYEDSDFCRELGKVILSAGKLEAQLIKLIENNENSVKATNYSKTMGSLITKAENLELLSKNWIASLRSLSEQRNHLTHNIFIILSDIIEDSKLIENINAEKHYNKKEILKELSEEKEYFEYSDIQLYIERAYILSDNLNSQANILQEKNR